MDSELILAESWRQCVTVFSSQKNRYHKFLGASKIFDLLEISLLLDKNFKPQYLGVSKNKTGAEYKQ